MERKIDFTPDLRLVSGRGMQFMPRFGLSADDMNRVMPSSLYRPSAGNTRSGASALAPSFARLGLPSGMLPAIGTGMESLAGTYSPTFTQQSRNLGLTPAPVTTLDDLLRQHGAGPYKPIPVPNQGQYGVGQVPGDAQVLNQYDQFFQEAAATYGVPVNLLKSIAWTERGWEGTSRSGARGLMQIMPNIWGGKAQQLGYADYATDPRQAILMGAWILNENRKQHGTWELAARAYLGFGTDAYGTTDDDYWASVRQKWDYLNSSGGSIGGGMPYTGGGTGLPSVFGGKSYGISQEVGGHAMDYSYGVGLGVGNAHPGIDIAAPAGSAAYFPGMNGMTGTVVTAGGSGYFCDAYGCGPGKGELKIQLSNGDQIIFGHMRNISVRPGQVINVGDYLGATGSAGSGDHLHLEYRRRSSQCSSGFCAIDPRAVIGY